MELNILHEVAVLQRLTIGQLRQRFAEATAASNRTWLVKRITWRLQAIAEGDLSEHARQCACELARDVDLRLNAPSDKLTSVSREPVTTATPSSIPAPLDQWLPPPGTILTRPYKGQQLHVQAFTEGFAYAGTVFPSLSAVAKAITGSHCNGYHFFRATLNNIHKETA